VPEVGDAGGEILDEYRQAVGAISNRPRHSEKNHYRHHNDGAAPGHHINKAPYEASQYQRENFPGGEIHGLLARIAEGDKLFRCSGMNSYRTVEIGFGGAHF